MGVKSLWTLLEPCGRRVDVKTLRGKTVAIDASGWIFRFLKAMRDDQGDIIPHAHTIGFLRRICKLLYLNIKPVFIFDGSTPALKKRTVAERRRRREQQDARVKKTAEKLLLNRLKQHALRAVEQAKSGAAGSGQEHKKMTPVLPGNDGEKSKAEQVSKDGATAVEATLDVQEAELTDDDDDEQAGFEVDIDDGVDPEVLSTLPPSMQLEIMLQVREKAMVAARGGFEERNGKPEEFSQYQLQEYLNSTRLRRQLDSVRGIAQQNSDVARPVAAEEGKHYVLYKDDDGSTENKGSHLQQGQKTNTKYERKPKSDGTLHISFCVDEEEIELDDMEWEDVDEEPRVAEDSVIRARHSKYWSLSHGFQKGRSLGKWGDDETSKEEVNEMRDLDEERMVQEAIEESLMVSGTAKVQASPLVKCKAMSTEVTGLENSTVSNVSENDKRKPCNLASKTEGLLPQKDDQSSDAIRIMVENAPCIVPQGTMDSKKKSREVNKGAVDRRIEEITDTIPSRGSVPPENVPGRKNGNESNYNAPVHLRQPSMVTKEQIDTQENRAKAVTGTEISEMDHDKEMQKVDPDDGTLAEPSESRRIKDKHISPSEVTLNSSNETLTIDMEKLMSEEASLRADRRAAAGQSDSPTDQMFAECQELLQMFGIPYIVAPTEAEAQCAWLDANDLVDAVVTDDNDAFLFGAKKVYRHIFEENKYVEEYRMDDVERELGLSRDSLICLGLLLGSDYTPGIAGVGVVNAVEIVSSFPGYDGLLEFEKWVNGIDEDIIALVKEKDGSSSVNETTEEFKQKHKSVRNSWLLPQDFPSQEVVQAYQNPLLDKSTSKFTFVRPDFSAVSSMCSRKFGWEDRTINDLITPVKNSLEESEKQRTLDNFVTFREKFAKVRSKRLAKAVDGIKKKKAKLQPAENKLDK